MANNGNSQLIDYGTLDTFPLSEALTGTATSTGKIVVGVGTLFTTEIGYNGDDSTIERKLDLGYIWNGADEWRQVTDVISDTLLYIESPFSVALSSDTISRIPTCRASKVEYHMITGGKVDGVQAISDIEDGEWRVAEFTNKPIQPHIVDGTGGRVHLIVTF